MLNEELNNNLKELKNSLEPTGIKDYSIFLDKFIDQEIDEVSLKELSEPFCWGGMLDTFSHVFKDKKTKKIIDTKELTRTICLQLFHMKEYFEASHSFIKNEETNEYELTYFDVNFSSFSDSEEVKKYIHKVARCYLAMQEYSKKQIKQVLATSLYKNDEFNQRVGDISRGILIKKLELPLIKITSNNSGVLVYNNHKLEKDYYFSV